MNDSPDCPLVGVAATYMTRLSELSADPGLVAAVDQHAAAVRDALIPAQRGSKNRPWNGSWNRSWNGARNGSWNGALAGPPKGVPSSSPHASPNRSVRREDLADYVLGFTDRLAEVAWTEPAGHDFATLRLTAVCWLIREYDLLAT
ncbi:DUF6401 family natural product biosynthesis protein [Streptomyces roseicoloratus]|uniref:DUF6401 family natural product biosynthesis protein n=1 Tax=Streptomyces roseicoloratus TaxID=2508722 RepID=A0ABY9RTR6_9ACTN|nr:DUF6401 family natural product biosynthesis protein [Streptomyces roseicoloratus]WMX45592.1 DUF6401 family natural product biosynthesis protein [Streptomyces roseicoloratus]